ncbi:hypothetical protein J7T55_008746 [Diaporthe amygdali]|uniref:uncharacterized protein n=1 Tax=Phomopsis amygdali TaxID=1214568 RepID=UPI0022FE736C|nr:uncharacterized protein J7T55_008746 [Diaporthe amygdali]KAJ0121581.1 hypothetical protein J7T55_008746 [Diaporthe amygdali]
MPADIEAFPPGVEYSPKADLRGDVYRPLPKIATGTVDPVVMTDDVPTSYNQTVLDDLNTALASNNAEKVADCFYPEQSNVVAAALLQVKSLRRIDGEIKLAGDPHFVAMSSVTDEKLFSYPSRDLNESKTIKTDEFLVGGGSSGRDTPNED